MPSEHGAARSTPSSSLGRVADVVAACVAVALAALWTWRIVPIGDVAQRVALCGQALIPLAAGTLFVVWTTALDRRMDPRGRRAWRMLAGAVTVWWLTGAIWEALGRPEVSVADAVQMAFFPLLLGGVFALPSAPLDRDARRRFWIDSALVVITGAAALWYFNVWPALASNARSLPSLLLNSIAYPIGDLVVLFAACAALGRGGDARSRRAVALIAASLVARFVGDLLSARNALSGGPVRDGFADLTWLTAAGFIGFAATLHRRVGRESTSSDVPRVGDVSVLPYAGAITLFAFLLATRPSWSERHAGVLVATVIATALVLARQFLATRQILRLQTRRAQHEAERASEARFRALVQQSTDVIVIVEANGRIRYASPSVERLFGVPTERVPGMSLLEFVHPDDVARARDAFRATVAEPGPAAPSQFRAAAGGLWRDVECVGTNCLDDPQVRGVVLTVRDVTERARLEAQLLHQAYHDPLTGLANRALFRDRVQHALQREAREAHGIVVLFLDLDDFKTVNDSLGHREGDRLLTVIAERLLNATRGCDTVARLGGDEFAVLLENARTDDDATIVAERIVKALKTPVQLGDQQVSVGASVGIARANVDDGAEELLRNADVAMYKAKQRGKNTYEIFAPAMHAALRDRMELEADLRRAVDELHCAEFMVHYQPIVELSDGRVTGVEALARWQHPKRGLVSPLTFIPIAESTGLIVPLGRWVLREACRQAARWREVRGTPLTLTVNLSARQIGHASIVDDVRDALADAGVEPRSLVLEITESVIVQDAEAALRTLHALKDLGVRLAIDDFGTGYSSLGYLQEFPIDILKIDKAFVDGVARGGPRSALTRTIVALGDSLELRCVAEGIEDDAQRQQLQALGCTYGQGFLFARPMPPDELATLIAETVDVTVEQA